VIVGNNIFLVRTYLLSSGIFPLRIQKTNRSTGFLSEFHRYYRRRPLIRHFLEIMSSIRTYCQNTIALLALKIRANQNASFFLNLCATFPGHQYKNNILKERERAVVTSKITVTYLLLLMIRSIPKYEVRSSSYVTCHATRPLQRLSKENKITSYRTPYG